MTIHSHPPRFICLMHRSNRIKSECNRSKQPHVFQGFSGGPNFLREVVLLSMLFLGKESKTLVLPHVSCLLNCLDSTGQEANGRFWQFRIIGWVLSYTGPTVKRTWTKLHLSLNNHTVSLLWLLQNQSQDLINSEKLGHIYFPTVAVVTKDNSKYNPHLHD